MKQLLLICAAILFIGLFNLPIGYYTFLRLVVTIGAALVVVSEYKEGLNIWIITFSLMAILFNPLIPVYLGNKSAWMPIDIIAGIIFVAKSLTYKSK